MTLAPGRGWRVVIAVETISPEGSSIAWARKPLVPKSMPIATCTIIETLPAL
jgi:hypothetical protein